MSGLVSYGGDPSVTVARSEIERITAGLASIQNRLTDELQPLAQLNGLLHHLQLDAHLPETLIRLGLQRHGCFVASESYFFGDARIAHHLSTVADAIHTHPWLQKIVPSSVWAGLATTVGLAAFSNSNLTALGVRAAVGEVPVDKIGNSISRLPNHEVKLVPISPSVTYQKPRSLSGLASRLNNEAGNIRLERYQTAKGSLVVMYLPGTSDWNPATSKKAFDVRSDLELLGSSEKSTSYRAANAAMDAFGVTRTERLIVVGYSQGGMVASELAETHKNVEAIVTMGSPIAKEEIPSHVKVISLEHSNDVVPALSGATNPMTENWATASRHVDVNPGETIFKAHRMQEYVETAALADQSTDSGLVRLRVDVLRDLSASTLVEAKEFSPLKATS